MTPLNISRAERCGPEDRKEVHAAKAVKEKGRSVSVDGVNRYRIVVVMDLYETWSKKNRHLPIYAQSVYSRNLKLVSPNCDCTYLQAFNGCDHPPVSFIGGITQLFMAQRWSKLVAQAARMSVPE